MKQSIEKALSYAKINLSLNVCGIESGMHLLDSVTTSVSLADVITVSEGKGEVTYNGVPSLYERDSVKKAFDYLSLKLGKVSLRADIEKHLPERAGIGGSSADAAAAIVLACKLLKVDIATLDMREIAEKVGSDVPYMMRGGYCRLRGKGERLDSFVGKPLNFVLFYGRGGGVSTPECFALFDKLNPVVAKESDLSTRLIRAIENGEIDRVAELCGNDLEEAAMRLNPFVEKRKTALKKVGALAAFMTGSGSAVVGLFDSAAQSEKAAERINAEYAEIGIGVAVTSKERGVEYLD